MVNSFSWVEQDPQEIFESVVKCLNQLQNDLKKLNSSFPVACGITNQRETVVAFRKSTSEPLYNAISWMDVRTACLVNELKSEGLVLEKFQNSTGLKASTFFSAFKIKWLLENVTLIQEAAKIEDLAFCTIDSWILWKLTNGKSYYTDPSNASRTFLYNIDFGRWDPEIMNHFKIDPNWIPGIKQFGEIYGEISEHFPFSNCEITAIIGDQQSSLIGHWGKDFLGKVKCTFGTGAFLLRSIETRSTTGSSEALKTVILNDKLVEEFPIVCAGSLIKWLQNSLYFINTPDELNHLDFTPQSHDESVYFIPNLSGCLFPLWDPSARGSFHNLSLKCGISEMILSVLESVAFCIRRALENFNVTVLSVDGGMCNNRRFCQLLANICNCSISKL